MASPSCYDKALSLLALRSHFRRQLEEKLRQRGYDSSSIEETLGRLAEIGYLDDHRVAREFVNARLRRGPVGRRRMRLELERRGAVEAALEEALAEAFDGSDELEAAREAAKRWRRRGRGDATALARHLERQGFTTSSILRLVAEFRSASAPAE